MSQDPKAAAESLARVRQLLAEWLMSNAESRETVAAILKLLDPVDSFILGQMGRPTAEQQPEGDGARGGTKTTYSIEKKKNEVETLTEHRQGGSMPYRCPKYMYTATVDVLAKTGQPMAFEEVLRGVGATLPDPSDWQVRTVLRFLMNANSPLIVRERNKYRPLHPTKLAAEAKAAWQSLAKASK